MMKKDVQLLDCTLRDGGLGLEDISKSSIEEKGMSQESIDGIIELFSESNIDIVELGSIEISECDKKMFGIYPNIETISMKIPAKKSDNQLYAALYRGPDTPIDDIPVWNPSLCEVVRVIVRYSELQKSLDFCRSLSEKGYKVFIQPMLTMRYSEDELEMIIQAANSMDAYALYFVDSYGYMKSTDVERLYQRYDNGLKKNIRIGFHSHNNLNLWFL